jgi:hypothetical protein
MDRQTKSSYRISNNADLRLAEDMFSEEINIVQSMWDDLGVTEGYRALFEGIAKELEENLRKEFIDFEIGALKKFSDNLMVST